jgi:hypothetical protein
MRTLQFRHGAPWPSSMARKRNRAVAWSGQVERGDAHLFDVAVGCAFVIGMVAEKPQMPTASAFRTALGGWNGGVSASDELFGKATRRV